MCSTASSPSPMAGFHRDRRRGCATLTPVLCAMLMKPPKARSRAPFHHGPGDDAFNRWFERLTGRCVAILDGSPHACSPSAP